MQKLEYFDVLAHINILSAQIRQANANFSPFLSRYSPVIKYRIHDLFLPHPPLNHCVGGPDGNAGDNPGKGIHIEQPIEGAEAGSHGINPYQAEDAGAENGENGGGHGIAVTTQGGAADFVRAGKELEKQHALQAEGGIMENVRIGGEDTDEYAFLPNNQPVEQSAPEKTQEHALTKHFLAAIDLSGAVILADESHRRLGKGADDKEAVVFIVDRRRGARHGIGAEAVDGGLHEDVGKGEDHPLHACRHPDAQHVAEFIPLYGDFLPLQAERLLFAKQEEDDNGGADNIGCHGGYRHAGNAHLEANHKHEVQSGVDDARRNQAVERTFRIAHAPENGSSEIINHHEGHAEEIDAEIERGKVDDIVGRIHQLQDGARQ